MNENAQKMMRTHIEAHIEEAKKCRTDRLPLMRRDFSLTPGQQRTHDRLQEKITANEPFIFPVIRPTLRPALLDFSLYCKKIETPLTWKEVLANLDKLHSKDSSEEDYFCSLYSDCNGYIQTLREDNGYILEVCYYSSERNYASLYTEDYTHYCACLCPPLKQYDKPIFRSQKEVGEYQHYHSLDTVKEAFRAFWLGAPMPPYLCWRILEI